MEPFGVPPGARVWLELVLGTPVVLWWGWPFFRRLVASVRNRSPNMYTLIGLGVALAYLFSLAAVLAPGLFPEEFREEGGHVGAYFEAAAVIVTLVLLGEVMQLRALGQRSQAIKQLLAPAPNAPLRIEPDGREVEVPLAEVQSSHLVLERHLHDFELRVVRIHLVPGQEVGKAGMRDAFCEPEAQTAPSAVSGSALARARFCKRREDLPRLFKKNLPGLCEARAARSTVKQLHTKVGLELLDRARQRRLFYVQALCGPQKVQFLGDCDEVAKTA